MRKWKFRCNYCGDETYANFYLVFLKAIFRNRFYVNCNKCHKTSCYLFMPKIVHESTDKVERKLNKEDLWDSRIK